jgi:signal transduction histidine kinase/ABC-type amino acid transport substrate-binding protein
MQFAGVSLIARKPGCPWRSRVGSTLLAVALVPLGFFLLSPIGAAGAAAQDTETGESVLTQQFVLGAPADFYPYSELGDNGALDGFAVDITNAVARLMRLKLQLKALPNATLTESLSQGDIDAVAFIAETNYRDKFMDFSVPVVELEVGVVVRDNDDRIHRLKDLQGMRIAVGPASSHGEKILNYFLKGSTPVYTDKWEESLQRVQSSECAGAIMSRFRAAALIDRLGLKGLRLMDAKLPGYTFRCGFAVKKGDSVLLARLNEGLAALHSSGEFDALYQKWFGRYEKTKITEKQVLILVVSMLALGFVLSSLAFLRQRSLSRRIARQAAELGEQRALLSTLFENHPLATVVVEMVKGQNPQVLSMNREACRLFSLKPGASAGPTLESLGLDPEFLRVITDLLDRFRDGGDLASTEIKLPRLRLVLETLVIGIGPASAERQRACVLIADVTRRRMIDQEVSQSRRVRALGELVGGIAHEFNNLLTPILATADMLKEENRSNPDLTRDLELIEQASKRAADLTQRLLTFGRKSSADAVSVQLAPVVASCFALIHSTIDRRIVLKSEVPEHLPAVRANPTDLNQILFNLIINARDALVERLARSAGREWTPELVVSGHELSADEAQRGHGTSSDPAQGWIQITVKDNGTGIPPEVIDQIFDPFFTTKKAGKGTGLGLSSVWQLVADSGGTVRVESQAGFGTHFIVVLPTDPAPGQEPAEAVGKATPSPVLAGRAVLVVEDDPLVARAAAAMLEKLGLRVSVANDGDLGWKEFTANPLGFALLLVDLNLPKMSGTDFVRRVRQTAFAGKIVVTSGNLADAEVALLRQLGVDRILPKPFNLEELSRALE